MQTIVGGGVSRNSQEAINRIGRPDLLLTFSERRASAKEIIASLHRELDLAHTALRRGFQSENKWRRMALTDELTGLYNRRGFQLLTQQRLGRTCSVGRPFTLVLLDVDGLKSVNDSFGHREGDRALERIATVLRRAFRTSDIVARVGGDEFAVLAGETAETDVEPLKARIEDELIRANDRNRQYQLSLSLGAVPFVTAETLDDAALSADRMLYEHKRARCGRGLKLVTTPLLMKQATPLQETLGGGA